MADVELSRSLEALAERLPSVARVDTVFGQPVAGGKTIVPVARVGGGRGRRFPQSAAGEPSGEDSGMGSGASTVSPVGAAEVTKAQLDACQDQAPIRATP